jgi:ubiquinone/menaquinone biosynthesis C-methylase UbiE
VKLNLGAGAHPLDGFENLDPTYDGWTFTDGLPFAPDATVEAITVSHALMMVPLPDWPDVFEEFARVLKPGGVIRITEDATDDRRSSRYGGFHDAVTLTSRSLVRVHLEMVDLTVEDVAPGFSHFRDDSLIQQWHGAPPKVFAIEGLKL